MSCLHSNSSSHRFCSECGEVLPRLLCRCGAINDDEYQFCVSCGCSLAEKHAEVKGQMRKEKFKLKEFLVAPESMSLSEDTNKTVSQDDIDKLMR